MQTATPVTSAGLPRPRWHRVYFWLAAFDVLTVSLGLLLTHLIMDVYTRSVALNKRWVDLLHDSSELGKRAAAVNEPGNRVFGNAQVSAEKANVESRHQEFQDALRDFRGRLAKVADAAEAARLEPSLAAVESEMAWMVKEADRVFAFLTTGPAAEAGKAMTAMDQRHADLNRELAAFREEVGHIQDEYFVGQTTAAARYQRFEYALGLGILLMVGGATLYGSRLAREAAAHTQALRESEQLLEQRVRERTAELRASEERYRSLAKRVLTAQEDERRRIARDLHDEVGQSLTSVLIGLRTAEDAPSPAAARERLGELRRIAADALDEVRRLARGLRPSVLDDLGLGPALERHAEDFARAHGVRVAVYAKGLEERLPDEVETTLYRIVQEALTNAARHARAATVEVTVERAAGSVSATVADDGRGFDCTDVLREQALDGHFGLSGMRERAGLLHGSLVIASRPGAGTTVRVALPLAEERHGEDPRAGRR